MIKGRILYTSDKSLYLSRRAKIFHSIDGGESWQLWAVLPIGFWQRLMMGVPLLARLLRLGIHHLAFSRSKAIIIANRESFLIENDKIHHLGPLNGSRPITICSTEDAVYYGEYRSNSERSKIHIWKLNLLNYSWQAIWRFDSVRHVHGVSYDPFTRTIWVTTGDDDTEAAIWRTDDNFRTLHRVVGGTQQFRAVQLLFTTEHVYFGSDAPNELNHIYRMDRSGHNLERLASVSGSVFYGYQVGNNLFFSTAVEPSTINTTSFSEVWCSSDGASWKKILKFRKDRLPMKYFQYGQVFFPAGEGNNETFYCTPFATQNHEQTIIISKKNLTNIIEVPH